eukprot:TRINITY_DN11415_c0_g1_i1.p1 TRINITY_DN11415_c0_g1~~TRINITY_DN11415_c0_g1_i1.p1  ORF type:complete len:595 (-),score=97.87 TRINITY_DN11415_c0_g1_i1:241-2025(-)
MESMDTEDNIPPLPPRPPQQRCMSARPSVRSRVDHSSLMGVVTGTQMSHIVDKEFVMAVERERILQQPKNGRWFEPTQIRLKEVDPRRLLEARGLRGVTSDCSHCTQRFDASCKAAATADIGNARQYLMTFAGSKMESQVPMGPGYDYDGNDHSESSKSNGDDDEDEQTSVSEEDEEEESEATSKTDTRQNIRGIRGMERGLSDMGSSDTYTSSDEDGSFGGSSSSNSVDVTAKRRAPAGPLSRRTGAVQPSGRHGSMEDGMGKQNSMNVKLGQLDQASAVGLFLCSRRNHPQFLFEKVYARRCTELNIHINSGVESILLDSALCFCNLESVNLTNLLLGDRGVLGVLPLFKSARRLKCLNLGGNKIREKGFRELTLQLSDPEVCSLLVVLDVSYNPISSTSATDLVTLLTKRRSILVLGMIGTDMPSVRRQNLLRRTLDSFAQAPTSDMCQAWQLSSPGTGFADSELWVQCASVVESSCSREQLAECMELVAKCKAANTDGPGGATGASAVLQLSKGSRNNKAGVAMSEATSKRAYSEASQSQTRPQSARPTRPMSAGTSSSSSSAVSWMDRLKGNTSALNAPPPQFRRAVCS